MGPPPKGASGMAESRARMARVLGQSSCNGAAGSRGPGPGDFDPVTNRSAARGARGHGGLLVGGLDFRVHSRQEAHGPGNDSSQRLERQPTSGAGWVGRLSLSFMR